MSPRSIGSHRYTNLLTKMRSWSSSEGIMLVPSTFTGWYRKMMMNAEIASEMMRSRSHTASTGVLRLRDGPGALPGSLYDGSLPPSAILILILIRNLRLPERLLMERRASRPSKRTSYRHGEDGRGRPALHVPSEDAPRLRLGLQSLDEDPSLVSSVASSWRPWSVLP